MEIQVMPVYGDDLYKKSKFKSFNKITLDDFRIFTGTNFKVTQILFIDDRKHKRYKWLLILLWKLFKIKIDIEIKQKYLNHLNIV